MPLAPRPARGSSSLLRSFSLAVGQLALAWLLALPVAAQDAAAPPSGDDGGLAVPEAAAIDAGAPEAPATAGNDVAQPLESTGVQQLQAYHRLGPNDYLRIILTAGETLSYDRRVNGAGELTLPMVGVLPVEGLTIEQVRTELEERYSLYYIAPMVQVDLLDIGRIRILIIQEGGRTSIRTIANGTTLLNVIGGGLQFRRAVVVRGGQALFNEMTEAAALPQAPPPMPQEPLPATGVLENPVGEEIIQRNGVIAAPTALASRSRLRIEELAERPDVEIFSVDTAALSRTGELETYNVRLRHGDIIYLTNSVEGTGPTRAGAVRLVQIVGTPVAGVYPLLPGETLADLLQLSGFVDLPSLNLRNVVLERRDKDGELKRIILNLDPAGDGLARLDEVGLAHRDVVRILPHLRQVFVLGEVGEPGVYGYSEQWLAQDYIAAAGGHTREANLHEVYVVRPERDLGETTQQPASYLVDLITKVRGELQAGYSVLPGDVIFVTHKSRRFGLGDVTSALNTVFLGLNYFDRLDDGTTPTNENPEL